MIIYNLFPLLAGPFSQWQKHFARAAVMGFDWVFVNPIQRLGASGSLYSIADSFSFNPVLLDPASAASPEEQVRQMLADAQAAGLKAMIDLVLNHCAIDSPLTRQHPEWFVREPNGHIANASCQHERRTVVWKDLAQFDHRHTRDPEGLYRHCLRIVQFLLSLGFTGFRCDAAYQVTRYFWHRLIHDVKARHPQAVFVAETLGCTADRTKETARAGFGYVFNSSKYWNFYDWWLIEQYNLVRETAASISFPESHDTPRLCTELNGNVNGLKQRYLFAALFSTGVMMPIGFEFGFRKPLHVIHTTPADWEDTGIDLTSYIANVNAIKKNHPVFQEECPTNILPCNNPNVLLIWKASAKHRDEALLILNKDPWNHQDFYTDHFRHFIQSGEPLQDVSPEFPLEYIHEPFHYSLRPGQGIVLVTTRG
ncbi:MAG TPA: alpha-amylase family glycosyl hydrolase [Candidatus Acidoferrum sp.]|jgi:starch synthase (maltosyl-transferring)|nr:alpha-amylase family glycosyl hydrolase [Candidatus Acidoferrum sp.]